MHQCLLIDEIITPIFEYLADDKTELAALARTCRAFSDNALDILWHDIRGLTSLNDLIKSTVPLHLWEEIPIPFYSVHESRSKNMILFHAMPRPSDWDRFARYASRIRLIEIFRDTDGGPRIAPGFGMSVFQYLSLYGPPPPLLPRLYRLVWNDTYPSLAIPYINLFLGERMHRISLDIAEPWSSPSKLVTIMTQIRHKCPLLKSIDVKDHVMRNSHGVVSPVTHVIGSFSHLTSLCLACKMQDYQAISDLAKLPALETLTLTLDPDSVSTLPSLKSPFPFLKSFYIRSVNPDILIAWLCLVRLSPSPLAKLAIEWYGEATLTEAKLFNVPPRLRSAFQNLELLYVRVPHLMVCTKLIQHIHLSNLERLYVIYASPARNDLNICIKVVSERCSSSFLFAFAIISTGSWDDHRAYDRTLRPLLTLESLETVIIAPKCDFNLSDSLIADMAKAWPDLEHIEIGVDNYRENTSRITFEGLIPLARYCPWLVYIELPVNAYSIPKRASLVQIDDESQNWSVERLYFGCSPISSEDVLNAADFIRRLFPRLKHFKAQHPPDGHPTTEKDADEICPWLEVRKILLQGRCTCQKTRTRAELISHL